MSNKRIEHVTDLIRWGQDMSAECRRCGRFAVYDANEVLAWLRSKGKPTGWPPAIRFRCKCGSRDMRFGFGPVTLRPNPLPARPVVLVPIHVREPRG